MLSALASSPVVADPVVARILRQARTHFFTRGYSQCTMDELAVELGMSKKTLYVHFGSKDEIVRAVIDELGREIRADAEALLANRHLTLAEKLRGFAEGMLERMACLNPRTIRELQRFAPALHQRVVEIRQKNIPYIFGRFIEEGKLSGKVRAEVDSAFAVEFYLHAVSGLFESGALDRLGLAPRELAPRAIDLFFRGLLTPAGRKEHEKLFAR
jgi:AcrR family transcriptional regulator